MLARMRSNRSLHTLLVGMQNGTATLQNRLAICYKANQNLTIWSSNHVPRYLPNWSGNLCPYKNLPMNFHCSFTHSGQKPEASKISFNRWIDTQTVIHRYNAILLHDKKKWAIKLQENMNETSMHIAKWKKPIREGYMILIIWCPEKAKL